MWVAHRVMVTTFAAIATSTGAPVRDELNEVPADGHNVLADGVARQRRLDEDQRTGTWSAKRTRGGGHPATVVVPAGPRIAAHHHHDPRWPRRGSAPTGNSPTGRANRVHPGGGGRAETAAAPRERLLRHAASEDPTSCARAGSPCGGFTMDVIRSLEAERRPRQWQSASWGLGHGRGRRGTARPRGDALLENAAGTRSGDMIQCGAG